MKSKVLLLLSVSLCMATEVKEDAKKELDKLQGSWTLIGWEKPGEKLSEKVIKENPLALTIKGTSYAFKGEGLTIEGSITLDASKKPKTLDARWKNDQGKEESTVGIYEVDEDTLKVCFSAGKDRPTAFKTKPNSDEILQVFKHVK